MRTKLFARLCCVAFAFGMVMIASSDGSGTGTSAPTSCSSDPNTCTGTSHANGWGCSTVAVNNQPACCAYVQYICSGGGTGYTNRWIDGDACINLGGGYSCSGTAPSGSGGTDPNGS